MGCVIPYKPGGKNILKGETDGNPPAAFVRFFLQDRTGLPHAVDLLVGVLLQSAPMLLGTLDSVAKAMSWMPKRLGVVSPQQGELQEWRFPGHDSCECD